MMINQKIEIIDITTDYEVRACASKLVKEALGSSNKDVNIDTFSRCNKVFASIIENCMSGAIGVSAHDVFEVDRLGVDAKFRLLGVGYSLLSFAESTAKEKEYERIYLHSKPSSLEFYYSCGYFAYDSKKPLELVKEL